MLLIKKREAFMIFTHDLHLIVRKKDSNDKCSSLAKSNKAYTNVLS